MALQVAACKSPVPRLLVPLDETWGVLCASIHGDGSLCPGCRRSAPHSHEHHPPHEHPPPGEAQPRRKAT